VSRWSPAQSRIGTLVNLLCVLIPPDSFPVVPSCSIVIRTEQTMDHSSNMPGGMLSLHFCILRVGAVFATVASSFVMRSLCAHTAANYSKLADSCRHKIFVSSSDQRTVCTICACMLLSPYSPMVHLVNSSLQVVLVRVYGIQLYFCVFDMIYNLEVLLCGTAHQA